VRHVAYWATVPVAAGAGGADTAAAFFTGPVFFAVFAAAFGAAFLTAAFLTTAFLTDAFFVTGAAFLAVFAILACALAAFASRQRFLVAAMMRFIPSSLILGFGFGGSGAAGAGGADGRFDSAHLFRCASAMARRPAALNFRRLGFGACGGAAAAAEPPESI